MGEIKPFKELTDDYFVGNFGVEEATNEVLRRCKRIYPTDSDLNEGEIGDYGVDHNIRKCLTSPLLVRNFNFI